MISQDPEAFFQFIMGGDEGGEGGEEGGEGGQLPPGTIMVTPEEKGAIDRLVALGFNRQLAIEAFFSCDKDEAMAANYCFDRQLEENLSGGGAGNQNYGDDYPEDDGGDDDNVFNQ